MKTIIVVDDDPHITKVIQRYLEGQSYSVITSHDGEEAVRLARAHQPDLILTDAQMPGLDGQALCRVLRKDIQTQSIPLVMMSGHQVEESNILAGFEGGVDDYVLKPLSMPILGARIEAILKRVGHQHDRKRVWERFSLEINLEGRSVKIEDKPIVLTRKEFDLFYQLISKPGRVLSVPYLLQTVWGYDPSDYKDSRTIEAHISHVRRKCGPAIGKRLVNVTGFGYKFEDSL